MTNKKRNFPTLTSDFISFETYRKVESYFVIILFIIFGNLALAIFDTFYVLFSRHCKYVNCILNYIKKIC